jgi:conjugal transfer pilus assembly protein TraV
MNTYFKITLVATSVALAGCAGTFNTSDNDSFGCGLPKGETCKTPSAVYKSTNADLPKTEFDEPLNIQKSIPGLAATAKAVPAPGVAYTTAPGPRPIREPAQVVRIWIAPWVDKNDNLSLAQYQYAEIKPRTWSIGIEEGRGPGYVIPHLAIGNVAPVKPAPEAGQLREQPAPAPARTSEQAPSPYQGAIDSVMSNMPRINPEAPQ